MDASQRGSASTASTKTKQETRSSNQHELHQFRTPSDIEGQVSPSVNEDAFGNEEGAEIKYKTCAWW